MTTAILGAFMAHFRAAGETAAAFSQRGRAANSPSRAVCFCQPRPRVQSFDDTGVEAPYWPLGGAVVLIAIEGDLYDQGDGLVRHFYRSIYAALPFPVDHRLSLLVAPADPIAGLGKNLRTCHVIYEPDDRGSLPPNLVTLEHQEGRARIELSAFEQFLVVRKAKIEFRYGLRPDLSDILKPAAEGFFHSNGNSRVRIGIFHEREGADDHDIDRIGQKRGFAGELRALAEQHIVVIGVDRVGDLNIDRGGRLHGRAELGRKSARVAIRFRELRKRTMNVKNRTWTPKPTVSTPAVIRASPRMGIAM